MNINGTNALYLTLAGYGYSIRAFPQGGARSSLTLGFVLESLWDSREAGRL